MLTPFTTNTNTTSTTAAADLIKVNDERKKLKKRENGKNKISG
jgi:hypothetical protein